MPVGAGESGKSTIFKQMRILNISTFDANERAEFRTVLRGNVVSTLKTLIQANAGKVCFLPMATPPLTSSAWKGQDLRSIGARSSDGQRQCTRPLDLCAVSCDRPQEDWTAEQLDDIKKLIADKSITKAAETRHAELQLLESTKCVGICGFMLT